MIQHMVGMQMSKIQHIDYLQAPGITMLVID